MSKIIASAAIRGAHKIVNHAEQKWQQAMDKWGAKEPVGFPNTAYYLPYGAGSEKMQISLATPGEGEAPPTLPGTSP